jgi:GxxExxY protein
MEPTELLFKDETYALLGACFEMYKDKGCGFHEPIYQECMEIELTHRKVPFLSQPHLPLTYRGQLLRQGFIPDFVCYGKIILELKAVPTLLDEHRAQVINYLKASGHLIGLLVNFGHYPKVQYERIMNTKNDYNHPALDEVTL